MQQQQQTITQPVKQSTTFYHSLTTSSAQQQQYERQPNFTNEISEFDYSADESVQSFTMEQQFCSDGQRKFDYGGEEIEF